MLGVLGVIGGRPQGVAADFLTLATGVGLSGPGQFVVFVASLVFLAQQFLQAFQVQLVVAKQARFDLADGGQQLLPALRQRVGTEAYVRLLAVGCWLLAVGCWLLAVGCWLLAVGCWLLAIILLANRLISMNFTSSHDPAHAKQLL